MTHMFKPGDRVRVASWQCNQEYEVASAWEENERTVVLVDVDGAGNEFFADELELVAPALDPLPARFRAGVPVSDSFPVEGFSADDHAACYESDLEMLAEALDNGAIAIHAASVRAGWWSDPATGKPIKRNVFEMLALIHSEISEALEGHRKGLRDDKLPQYPMLAVELADTVIRILDLAGAMEIDLGEIVAAKARFNLTREDHKPENRIRAGGKAV